LELSCSFLPCCSRSWPSCGSARNDQRETSDRSCRCGVRFRGPSPRRFGGVTRSLGSGGSPFDQRVCHARGSVGRRVHGVAPDGQPHGRGYASHEHGALDRQARDGGMSCERDPCRLHLGTQFRPTRPCGRSGEAGSVEWSCHPPVPEVASRLEPDCASRSAHQRRRSEHGVDPTREVRPTRLPSSLPLASAYCQHGERSTPRAVRQTVSWSDLDNRRPAPTGCVLTSGPGHLPCSR